jgi:hypothetical protein
VAQRKTVWDNETSPDEPKLFLQRRGIVPDNGQFTERQLARELNRNGWRWRIAPDEAEAVKAFVPKGTTPPSITSHEADPITAMTLVLADAIRYDEEHGIGPNQPLQADLLVSAPNGRIVAIGEVKGGQSLSETEAARFRANLIRSSSEIALSPFFLLVWPDIGYLWDQREILHPTAPATITFPMAAVIERYLPWLNQGELPGSTQLALALAGWVADLADPTRLETAPAVHVFGQIDFLAAIRGASVLTDAPV